MKHSAVDCGQPPAVSDGQVIIMATTFQSTATYECNRGFEFPSGGLSLIECQADRTWSTPIPTCQREFREYTACDAKLLSFIP